MVSTTEIRALRRPPRPLLFRRAADLAVVLLGTISPAQAAFTTYFGIDQGNGNPPTTPVLSLAARSSFVSTLTGVGVESFESPDRQPVSHRAELRPDVDHRHLSTADSSITS